MAGYREFQTGEVLTAANVDDFLAKQSVMKFADAAARNTALGTAVGGANALREGMVAYLDDTDTVEFFDGTAWAAVGGGGFDSRTVITATNNNWSVPTLANNVVRATVIGGGGGGGGAGGSGGNIGGTGGTSNFGNYQSASGGVGGRPPVNGTTMNAGSAGAASHNGGQGAWTNAGNGKSGETGNGGQVEVAYVDLAGVNTVAVTVGGGGNGGTGAGNEPYTGSVGGRGEVIVEYLAG